MILGGAQAVSRRIGTSARWPEHQRRELSPLTRPCQRGLDQRRHRSGPSDRAWRRAARLGTNAAITLQNDAGLRILTDGTSVSQLQNATMTKGLNDTFVVTLAGLNPSGTETFNLSNAIFVQGNLTNFDPNDTYTQVLPGHFSVVGDGFTVDAWSLSVVNGNQLPVR